MADYVEERLGLGVRTAQELVRAEKALARLPRTAAAWASGRITAGHLRILTRVATERTESWWLRAATRLPVARLAEAVAQWRRAEAARGNGEAVADAPEEEPERVREVLRAPAWIAVLWKQTVDHVRTVVGRRVHSGGCLDVLLAEAQGAQPVGDLEAPARTDWPRRPVQRTALGILDKLDRTPFDPDCTTWKWYLTPPEPRRSARDLDVELFRMVGERQREEAELAERLRRAARTRSYREAGHGTLEAWVRAELGLSPRRLYYLLALGRRLDSLPALRAAFLEGRLSMKKAVLVGSVATRRTEAAWIERAAGVTLRRLDDEVAWWRQLEDVRPEVWELLDGGPLPDGIVLDPGREPRLHASARGGEGGREGGLHASAPRGEGGREAEGARAGCRSFGRDSSGTFDEEVDGRHASARGRTDETFDEEAVDGLHACARGGANDRGIKRGPAGCESTDEDLDARLHACAPRGLEDHGAECGPSGCDASDEDVAARLHVCASSDDCGTQAGPTDGGTPITARAFLAALEADQTAVPLPEHMCSLTFWLEPEVDDAWKARCAAHRHESGEPMEKWEVLALLMHNWWKTHENEETRRQRREHKTLERDGWRCKAPGCSSMGNGMLHEHHVIFKSRGGALSDPSNLITLCSAHHLSLLHNGYMRCYGEAPDNITWEMGIGEGQEPFLIYHGDTLIGGTGVKGEQPRGDDDVIG